MKIIKYVLLILAAALMLYHSVYFERLGDHRKAKTKQQFDPAAYVARFWQNLKGESTRAVDAADLLNLFASDMTAAVALHGRTLGVSRSHSFLLQGNGKIVEITDEAFIISISPAEQQQIAITADYLFGNDIRDASGLVSVSDFPNTMEFNTISSEINKIVAVEVLPVMAAAKVGSRIHFIGAATVNDEFPEISPLRVTPIHLTLSVE